VQLTVDGSQAPDGDHLLSRLRQNKILFYQSPTLCIDNGTDIALVERCLLSVIGISMMR